MTQNGIPTGDKNVTLRYTAIVAAGEAVTIGLLCLVFALLGRFDRTVVFGGLLGAGINIIYFFFLCLGVNRACTKETGASANVSLRISYIGRLAFMALGLAAGLKFSCFNSVCVIVPLLVTRPALSIASLLSKEVR